MTTTIKQTATRGISEVFSDAILIGRITERRGLYTPEPAATDWAQDDLFFSSRPEALAFLIGADWAFRREG